MTNLLYVRKLFAEATGRYDLVNQADWSDNGADRFINGAVRFLDSRHDTAKSVARYIETLPAGSSRIRFSNCRAVKEVWVADADGTQRLEKLTFQKLREEYPNLNGSDQDTGKPIYYAVAVSGLAQEQDMVDDTTAQTILDECVNDYQEIHVGSHEFYTTIVFAPPTDAEYTFNVFGYFYSKDLTADNDTNYWASLHPDLLTFAACYLMDIFYRNQAGAQLWIKAVDEGLRGIDNNLVLEDSADLNQMEG